MDLPKSYFLVLCAALKSLHELPPTHHGLRKAITALPDMAAASMSIAPSNSAKLPNVGAVIGEPFLHADDKARRSHTRGK